MNFWRRAWAEYWEVFAETRSDGQPSAVMTIVGWCLLVAFTVAVLTLAAGLVGGTVALLGAVGWLVTR